MTHDNRTHTSVTTRPQPGSVNTLIYRGRIFIGRIIGGQVYDAAGCLRSGDDFCRFVRASVLPEIELAGRTTADDIHDEFVQLIGAIDLACGQDQATWLTRDGKRIAAIVPVDGGDQR